MVRTILACLALAAWATGLCAQNSISPALDLSRLSSRDVRVIQGALAFDGAYQGLLDGAAGPRTAQAIAGYRSGTALRDLLARFQEEIRRMGWTSQLDAATGQSYVLPIALLEAGPVPDWDRPTPLDGESRSLAAPDGGLTVTRIVEPAAAVRRRHEAVLARHARGHEPYTLRSDNRWISSAEDQQGTRFYLQSLWAGQRWVSLSIRARPDNWQRLSLIAASFARRSGGGEPLTPEPGGPLEALLGTPIEPDYPAIEVRPLDPPTAAPEARPPVRRGRSGSGFYVNSSDLVTASHFLDDCEQPSLPDGAVLTRVAADEDLGIAVLTGGQAADWITLEPAGDVRTGDGVLAVGYRASDAAGTLITSAGRVMAPPEPTAGRNARLVFQADLSPGMSGGLLVDGQGNALGLMVSPTAGLAGLSAGDALPDHTELAVPAATLADFLRARGVSAEPNGRGGTLADRSQAIRRATVAILCD